jgi:DNA modification methylase
MSECRLILGDCLQAMADIPDGSIDLILADLPYGTTACKWDVVIPFEPLWAHYRRVLKPRGAVVLTASQPFTSMLVMSNPKWFRYEWVWDRVNKYTGHLNAKKRPMRRHETVLIFARAAHTYNPQRRRGVPYRVVNAAQRTAATYGAHHTEKLRSSDGLSAMPGSVLRIKGHDKKGVHPTQKPVALMEYLIRTYSHEGEMVLDNTMGSGTTGVACLNTGRRFLGIEKDPAIFAVADRRIDAARLPLRFA